MAYELSLSKRQSQSDNWLYGCKRKFVVEILLYIAATHWGFGRRCVQGFTMFYHPSVR